IGCVVPEPFLQLAFLSLPAIPSLKLTDRGLMDVDALRLVDVPAAGSSSALRPAPEQLDVPAWDGIRESTDPRQIKGFAGRRAASLEMRSMDRIERDAGRGG